MGRGILPNTVKDMAKYKGAEKGAHTQGGGSRKMRFHFFCIQRCHKDYRRGGTWHNGVQMMQESAVTQGIAKAIKVSHEILKSRIYEQSRGNASA